MYTFGREPTDSSGEGTTGRSSYCYSDAVARGETAKTERPDRSTRPPTNDWKSMDAVTLAKILIRRWYVVLPILALAGLLAVDTYRGGEPTYSSSYRVIILAPSKQTIQPPTLITTPRTVRVNPYGNAGGPRLLIEVLRPRLQNGVDIGRDNGNDATVSVAALDNSPIVIVTVNGSSAASVTDTIGKVQLAFPKILRDEQISVGSPPEQLYESHDLATPGTPFAIAPSKSKAIIAILGAGGMLAAILAVVSDSLIAAAYRRRRESCRRSVVGGLVTTLDRGRLQGGPQSDEATASVGDRPPTVPAGYTRYATAEAPRQDAAE